MTTNKKAEAETPQEVFNALLQAWRGAIVEVQKSWGPGNHTATLAATLDETESGWAARYAAASTNAMPPVYRIQSGAGWFSSGGSAPTFDPKKGKAWGNIGHVKNHLRMLMEIRAGWRRKNAFDTIPEDWRVIEIRGPVTRSVNARALMAGTGELA